MKKIFKISKNLIYMIKLSATFAPLQYIISVLEITWNSAAPFVNLLFPKWILDELSSEKRWEKIFVYIVLWTVVNGVLILINTLEGMLISPYENRCNVKEGIHYGQMDSQMDYGKLENGTILDEKNRIRNNLSLSYFAYSPCADFITTLIQLAGYTYIVSTLNPLMILFLLVIVFSGSVLSGKQLKIKYKYQSKITKFQRRFSYLFNVLIAYPYGKEVRINRAADWIIKKYEKNEKEYMNVFAENQKNIFVGDAISDLITFIQTIVLYVYSAYRLVVGAITIGSFSMYIGSVSAFINAFTSFVKQLKEMKFISDYIESYKKYVQQAIPSHLTSGVHDIDLSTDNHEIEFKNVSFRYPGSEKYALKNVSVKITNGQRLSVVGYNGSGKSTFVKLLCRLYEPTEGCILYNGVDISVYKYDQYIELLAVVFQDYNIYSLSVRENICLACNTDDEIVLRAIEQSGLSEKVGKLSHKLDTQVGREFYENGVEFSGGEGQKLACARAYVRKSPIVILDEPTASLDPISENQLYQRFNNIIGKKTAIYISHRLACVKFCDNIVVFVDGQIVESGTHNELMALDGVYHEMFSKQAEYYLDIEEE